MSKVKRLQLKGKHLLVYYSFPLLILLPVILSLIEIVKTETGIYDGMRTVNDYIEVSLPFLIVGLLFIFRQYWRLIFKEVQITYTDKDLQHALGKASVELKWRVEKNRNGVFRATGR